MHSCNSDIGLRLEPVFFSLLRPGTNILLDFFLLLGQCSQPRLLILLSGTVTGSLFFECHRYTFRLDESTTTTTLPPPVPRSTRPLRRNSTTLVKHNLLLSITIRHPHRQIEHGDINKTISQLLVDPLTLRLQRSPTKSRLRRTSSSRRPLIVVTNNQKIAPAPRFSGVQN